MFVSDIPISKSFSVKLVHDKNVCQHGVFEDTKGVIRIRKSKDRRHNGQKKKYKRTNDLQNTTQKTKD